MKGIIDNEGRLLIDRGQGPVYQKCPYGTLGECGHLCALFGDPEVAYTRPYTLVKLEICRKTLDFDDFKDFRK